MYTYVFLYVEEQVLVEGILAKLRHKSRPKAHLDAFHDGARQHAGETSDSVLVSLGHEPRDEVPEASPGEGGKFW